MRLIKRKRGTRMRNRKEFVKWSSTALVAVLLVAMVLPYQAQAAPEGGNGWEVVDEKWYWYEDGVRQGYDENDPSYRGKEIYDPGSNAWYWLDNVQQGAKAVNKDVYQESAAGEWAEKEDGTGKWVRYDAEGHMIKGWNINENGTYYFDVTYGTMAKGNRNIDGAEYIFDQKSGVLVSGSAGVENGWALINGKEYWYEHGVRQGYDKNDPSYRGKEIYDPDSDAWYWLDNVQQGAKAVSKDVYQESAAGEWAEKEDGTGKWVRYDENGHMIKGWSTNESGTYYFDPTYGTMAKGTVILDGKICEFDSSTGILIKETPLQKPYVEEKGLKFYHGTKFTGKGIRFNDEVYYGYKDFYEALENGWLEAYYEPIDVDYEITDISIKDTDKEGFQVITISAKSSGYNYIDGGIESYTKASLLFGAYNLCDSYTGRVLPLISSTINDAEMSYEMKLEWNGKTYPISYTVNVEWEWGEMVKKDPDYMFSSASQCGSAYTTIVVTAPKEYDGLALAIGKVTRPNTPEENENAGKINETERYILDSLEEDDFLISVREAYDRLN